jgi:uncharacterized protein (TIGR00297 family)
MFDPGFSPEKFFNGLVTAVGIAWFAYRAKALDRSGAMAAGLLGIVVFGLGGLGWALVMLSFFISSSALSRLFQQKKETLSHSFSKGSQRDAWQVAANGGAAGLLALFYFIFSEFTAAQGVFTALWLGFAGSLAAANADTWGTELGLFNPSQPIKIFAFQRVPKGTSGGISLVGTLASLLGSALIGGVAAVSSYYGWAPGEGLPSSSIFLVVTISGLLGALVDSMLGGTVQSIYYCPKCQKETEQHPLHNCGTATTHKRGLGWLDNDWVNAACTVSGALLGLFLSIFWF